MKFSLNTIRGINKRYGCAEDVAPSGIDDLVEKTGAQLGGVDEVIAIGDKYKDAVIVKVVSCHPHPDADKLKVCTIDTGKEKVQVVCGAPNVREGMLAVWLPPGATVPESVGKEPFVLEARELRGVVSNGMLASPKELALGDGHTGLLEIDGDYPPGTEFAQAFGLKDDAVIDIENKMFTHRPDLFGFLGIDRELAGIQRMPFKSPDWYTPAPEIPAVETEELPLEIVNELPELVPRFVAITMRDVKLDPSPVWLQVELAKVGIKSINNIVDYSNWFMLETGQPIHIYDYDKVQSLSNGDKARLIVRHPKPGEKITLLNGKTIEPHNQAMMVATDQALACVGGAIGGSNTEVGPETKNIIIEAANWDMYNMRRTSMEHGIFTDAVTRFTKGQSPLQNLAVVAKIADEIRQHADGKIASPVIDDNHVTPAAVERNSLYEPVRATTVFINQRLGLKLSADDMKKLLENVEFKVVVNGEDLTVTAPFWRTDIEIAEDIVEEVGRLYGYDKLPLELPKRDLTPAQRNEMFDLKSKIRETLSRAGANEVLTYSFVHGDLLDKVGQDKAKAFQVANALSPDLQYYRLSLMPSLLSKVHMNIKAGYDEFALFESGKVHSQDQVAEDGVPGEFEFTALVIAAADKLKKTGAPYYQARKYLTDLTGVELTFKPVGDDMKQYPVVKPYDLDRAALVSIKGGDFLGIIGEFRSEVRRELKLPKYAAGFEVDTTVLQKAFDKARSYVPLPRFPKVTQDITLKVPASLAYQELFDFVKSELSKGSPANTLPSLEPIDIYQAENDSTHTNVTIRLSIASYDRTLTDSEVNKLLDEAAVAAKTKFGAERL
jgi:phenylalanyl-tRNA synthetase beta chain